MTECVICTEELKDINLATTTCGHKFHFICLSKWHQGKNNHCPLCREKLLPDEKLPVKIPEEKLPEEKVREDPPVRQPMHVPEYDSDSDSDAVSDSDYDPAPRYYAPVFQTTVPPKIKKSFPRQDISKKKTSIRISSKKSSKKKKSTPISSRKKKSSLRRSPKKKDRSKRKYK